MKNSGMIAYAWYVWDKDYVGKPTIYEIKANQPYVGPFNKVDYFKIQLERSDIQGELIT